MGPIAAVASSVLAPAIGNIVGPLVGQLAGPLTNMLGGGISELLQGFEKAFLGGFGGPQSAPGQTGFPQLPSPFQPPPFINNPTGPFGGGSTGPVSGNDLKNVGATIDGLQAKAKDILSNPNANAEAKLEAQQDMEKADEMYKMMSKLLDQQSQMAQAAIQAIH